MDRLEAHAKALEADPAVEAELAELDRRLAEGWVPEAVPVEEVVRRLREAAYDS